MAALFSLSLIFTEIKNLNQNFRESSFETCDSKSCRLVVSKRYFALVMGLERFLCGVLKFNSSQFSLCRNAWMSASTTSGSSTHTISGLHSGKLFNTGRKLQARRSFSTSAQPSKDVTLFEHDRTHFFRLLSVFCGGQFVFWTYLAQFAYTGLRDTGAEKAKQSTKPPTTTGLAGMWSFEMNLGSNAWRYGFTLGCLAIGGGIVGLGAVFCRRSVFKVILHEGGKMVTVGTQSPLGPGRGRRITVPLSQVACHAHRQESTSFIPLRVKGHKFYFLLDKDGAIKNARLFDITVGAYRPI